MPYLTLALSIAILQGPPTGAQILRRCQSAYDSLRTFEQYVRATIDKQGGTAYISFARPGRLRVSGATMFGSKYDLLIDGKSTWINSMGHWTKVESPEMGIASITGISANAGTHVPALLMHTSWGSIGNLKSSDLHVSTQKIGGRTAYRLDAKSPTTTSIWIDAKSYLLIKTVTGVMHHAITVDFQVPKINQPISPKRFVK